ncbi:hypothetical protein TWF281_010214 [Arthrobotrys megalospora]
MVNRLFSFSNDHQFLWQKRNCLLNLFNLSYPPTIVCTARCTALLISRIIDRIKGSPTLIESTMADLAENVTFRQCAHLATPDHVTADFCLIPMGTPTASVSQHIANIQKLLAASGIKYSMHSAGTTLEGSWEEVTKVIGQAHTLLHNQGVVRIQTDIRIGSRTDKVQSMEDKVSAVEKILQADSDAVKPAAEE